MNKHKYSFLKLLNFLSGFFLSLLYAFFFLKRKKRIIFNSTNNKHFTFNSMSLFIDKKTHFEAEGFEVFFIVNDTNKRRLLNLQYPNSFISNKGIRNKLFILKSAIWVISTLDLPVAGGFLTRNRFVYHLGHGTPIKNIGLMEAQCSYIKKLYYNINATNISLYLSPSQFFIGYIGKAFGVKQDKVIVAPQPRIDSIYQTTNKLSHIRHDINTKLVLYCPTWRPFSELQLFPFDGFDINDFNDFLKINNVKILLRLHPLFEGDLSVYAKSNIIIFDSTLCFEISEVLADIDALMTDYSSIYCDYYLLNRPVAFIPYDLVEYSQKIGFSFNYNELTSDNYLSSLTDLKDFIISVNNDDFDMSQQEKIKLRFNYIPSLSACDFNFELICKKYKEIL